MEQSYTQTSKPGVDVVGLRLLFRLTRSRIIGIQVEGLPEGVQATKKTIFELAAEVIWDATLPEGAVVTANLEYEGEPLALTDFVWITEGDRDNIPIPIAEPVDPLMEARRANNPLETVVEEEDPVRVFEARWAEIERTTVPKVKKYQEFFWHYDHETHPQLIRRNPNIPEDERLRRISIIAEVGGILRDRVSQRASAAESGRTPQPGKLRQVPDDSWVDYLSRLQLGIVREYLPGSDQSIDTAAVTEAFEMFANGELRVEVADSVWNSEPDSAHHFSFAEFAFLALEKQTDANEWGSLLNGLVMSQEIFSHAYRPDRKRPFFYSDYKSTNFDDTKQVDANFKQQLRAKYAGKSLAELAEQAGNNACDAFQPRRVLG